MDVGVLTTNPKNPYLPSVMAHDGVDTLSPARTWAQFDDEGFEMFDAGLQVAKDAGKKITPRIRGGAGTPERYMDRSLVPTSGIPKGLTIPCPVLENGAPNVTWLGGFREMTLTLAEWVNANMVVADGPVHLTWSGARSAEIYVSEQMYQMIGCDPFTVGVFHDLVVQIAAAMPVHNPVELSISGLEQGQLLKDLQDDYIIPAMVGANHYREFWTQRNGFDDTAPYARTPDLSIGYGAQMVKAFRGDGKPFNWSAVFAGARDANLAYLEIYDASFVNLKTGQAAPGAAQLYAECAKA